jgi:tRNA pseudouridine13 synthase
MTSNSMMLKHAPEDFIVEEIPLREWNDSGPYAIFRLTKIGLNTEQAIDIISKRFHIPYKTIKYSGTKDRHAHTTQYISIPTKPDIENLYINEENLKLEHVGFLEEPLSLGTLEGNRFVITLREIGEKELKVLESKDLKNFSIPNYFDEQRFSNNNYNIGLCILKKDYKGATEYMCESSDIYADTARVYLTAYPNDYIGALKKIPRKTLLMFIHAVQSFIFNEALSEILVKNASYTGVEKYVIKYSLGEVVFYKDSKDYDDLEFKESLELVGFDTHTSNHYIKHIIEDKGIFPRDFIIRAFPDVSVEGTTRECFVKVKNLDVRMLENRAIIEFELPKGSYATMVVKALFND